MPMPTTLLPDLPAAILTIKITIFCRCFLENSDISHLGVNEIYNFCGTIGQHCFKLVCLIGVEKKLFKHIMHFNCITNMAIH